MRRRFCLNTATIKKMPLDQQIRLTSEAGFPRIGLWLDDIEAATKGGVSLETIDSWLDQACLKVEELCFLGGWQDAAEGNFASVLQSAHHICEVSENLGCDIVVVTPAPGLGFLDGAPARFRKVCQAASQHGVRIALEFPGTVAEVKDVATAWRIVSNADCENGGLVLDTFHFFLGGSKLEDLIKIPGEKIFIVHVSDPMDVPSDKLRTHHDFRTFLGEGILDFSPLLQTLHSLRYKGAFSLEIWNQQLSELSATDVLQKGFASLLRLEQVASSLNAVH